MTIVLLLASLCLPAELGAEIDSGQGSVGLRAGYRYVPNPFFAESLAAEDPVTSTYLGAPTLVLHFDYLPLAQVPLMIDIEWASERHDLSSGGWVQVYPLGFSLSSGYLPKLGWPVQPYAIAGIDQVAVVVEDGILSNERPVSAVVAALGGHVALGIMAPGLLAALPELMAIGELRYTLAPSTQRGRSFWLLGASATVGLAWRFDTTHIYRDVPGF